jgi:hypothetical protein
MIGRLNFFGGFKAGLSPHSSKAAGLSGVGVDGPMENRRVSRVNAAFHCL